MENNIYEFSFIDFRLLSIHFDIKSDKEYKLTKDIEVTTNLSLKHNFLPAKKELRLIMEVDICGDKLPFSINVEAGGLFHFAEYKNEIPSSHLDKIARINCAAIMFPYLREAVADIVRRSGLPQLNLPPFNFVEFYSEQKNKEKIQRKKKIKSENNATIK